MASATIGALRVNLSMNAGEFSRGARQASNSLDRISARARALGANMAKVGAGITVAIAGPMALIARATVKDFAKQEKAVAAVDAALKSMGKQAGFTSRELRDMAASLQQNSEFGDEEILHRLTANLLTFGNIQGQIFARAQQSAADLSARLGQDLQSSAVMLGKALNEPAVGLTALTRVGVSFTEEQKNMVKAMVKAGKTAEAQKLMLSELEKQYGGQAAAMGRTTEGQLTQINNAWGDFKEIIGAIVSEALPPLIDTLRDVVGWLKSLEPRTLRVSVAVAAFAAALGPLLLAVGAVIGPVTLLGVAMLKTAGHTIVAAKQIGTAIAGLVASSGPIGLFIAAAGVATAAWVAFGGDLKGIISSTVSFVSAAFDKLLSKISFVTDFVKLAWNGLTSAVRAALPEAMLDGIAQASAAVVGVAGGAADTIAAKFNTASGAVADVKNALTDFYNSFSNAPIGPKQQDVDLKSFMPKGFGDSGDQSGFGPGSVTTEQMTNQERLNQLIADQNEKLQEGRFIMESLQTPYQQMQADQARLSELFKAGAINAQILGKAQQRSVLDLASTYASAASQITSTLSNAFKDNKAFAQADAIVNTARGVTQALANSPPPLNFAQAAAVGAAGIAQINAIKSANKGGGATARAGSGGGATAATAASSGSSGGPTSNQTLFVRGLDKSQLFGGDAVADLAERLIDFQRDGGQVVLGGA